MRFEFHPYFEKPGDTGVGTPVAKTEKTDDDTNILDNLLDNDDDVNNSDDKRQKDARDKEEEVEEDLINDEDDKVKDEEEEKDELLDTNARGIDLKKIKDKYPEFAKTNEFRELRNSYHREAQYTELFPTLEDAKEAAENNETFNKLNAELIGKGDSGELLRAVREANPESFKKLTSSFLDHVAKLDNTQYVEIISPVVKRLAKQMYATGKKSLSRDPENNEGKALVATARNIMQYAFEDGDEVEKDDPKPDPKLSEKEKELEQREQRLTYEKFQGAYRICESSVERNLDKQILDGLDPDGKFNEFTSETLLERIKKEVKEQVANDPGHLRKMDSLWKRAEQSGFDRNSLSRIVAAYLERARPVIPNVRNKFRSIAIKGKSETPTDSSNRGPRIPNSGRSGRAPSNEGRTNLRAVDPKKIDYRKTTDNDIFDNKVKLKG